MRFLPSNLAVLSKVAARKNTKYLLNAVQFRETNRGYVASATDTRILARIVGNENPEAKDLPCFAVLASHPNGGTEAFIPAKDWAALLKVTPAQREATKQLSTLDVAGIVVTAKPKTYDAAEAEKQIATIVSSDNIAQHSRLQTIQCVDGRFPPVDEVLSARHPRVRVTLGIDDLIRLLEAARAIGDTVTIGLFTDQHNRTGGIHPVLVETQSADESQEFVGMIQPLVPGQTRIDKDDQPQVEDEVVPEILCPFCKATDYDCKHFLGSRDSFFQGAFAVDRGNQLSNLSMLFEDLELAANQFVASAVTKPKIISSLKPVRLRSLVETVARGEYRAFNDYLYEILCDTKLRFETGKCEDNSGPGCSSSVCLYWAGNVGAIINAVKNRLVRDIRCLKRV